MSEVLEFSRNWSIMANTDQDAKRIRILSDHVSKIEKENADLRAQLAEEKYVSDRALNAFATICVADEIFPDTNEKMQIDQTIEKVLAKLTEARKDRERLDCVLDHLKENTDLHNMTGHPEDNGVFLTYWGAGFAYTTRDDIDAAMKGGE